MSIAAAECLLILYAGNECGLCSILVAMNDCEAISSYSFINCCGVIGRSNDVSLLYYRHQLYFWCGTIVYTAAITSPPWSGMINEHDELAVIRL